ncbi:S8 family serine peptidase [Nonomuraea wenchangensis]|uniref:S8 family serine peptidase n=1 Tax=Nonomuraea wenchangensis TaxID=568860 RepID=UPI003438282F
MRKTTKRAAGAFLLVAASIIVLPPAHASAGAAGNARSVTLITGDRVVLAPDGSPLITPGKGREGIDFHTFGSGERLRVVPGDAIEPLRQGRLDPRLFEVSTLAASGYDDRSRHLALVVTGAPAIRSLRGGAGQRTLAAVDGFAVRQDRAQAVRFWQDLRNVEGKIWLDARVKPSLDTSVKQIGAPAAWAKGLTGAGVKVAVLDSGIDSAHPDLAGKVVARADFTETPDERDVSGHGTHVASTIAGTGASSGGRYRGAAPDAQLLDGKVCEPDFCTYSAILAGMQWAADQGARVVNMSLGGLDEPGLDPLEEAVQRLSESHGTLFVVAAGNDGADRSVSSPASADAALAVGAVDRTDRLADFSSKGPRVGDHGLKPEITAPGVEITAARSKDSAGSGPYVAMSGTSMATPHVAGTAALLAGAHANWKATELKAALMGSARPQPQTGVFAQGAGRVDAERAATQTVTADPPGLGFGLQRWPHADDEVLTRKLTYRNHGDSPVTLDLGVTSGTTFSVSPATLTVPSGGQAEATVTADTRTGEPDGFLSAFVEAKGPGGVVVSTPAAVEKEIESYDLTVNQTDRSGKPTANYQMVIWRLDAAEPSPQVFWPTESSMTFRLPRGEYLLDSTVLSEDGVALLVQPRLRLDRAWTVEADARLGRPTAIRPPTPGAELKEGSVAYSFRTPGRLNVRGWYPRSFATAFTAQLGPKQTEEGMLTRVSAHYQAGQDSYRLAWFERDRMITGYDRAVDPKSLARVRVDVAEHLPGAQVLVSRQAAPSHGVMPTRAGLNELTPPSTLTEYVNTDDGIRWYATMVEYGADDQITTLSSAPVRVRPGSVSTELWNRGVFGPSLPAEDQPREPASRTGDTIAVDLPMFGDGRGSIGDSWPATEHVSLYRDGQLVGESDWLMESFTVPAGGGTYRLVADAERGESAVLSTRSSATWTFRSESTSSPTRLPLSVVRFTPDLDARNSAPAGRRFMVPFTVQRLAGSAAGPAREVVVEVSYDDGATWSRAKTAGSKVVLDHPGRSGFVSLRASSSDVNGNTVEQSVIRAYRITAP